MFNSHGDEALERDDGIAPARSAAPGEPWRVASGT